MNDDESDDRPYRVWARTDAHHARLLVEPSFEAAAIAFAEHLPFVAGLTETNLVVHDIQSGREHSYTIHLDAGEPAEIV